MIGPSTQNLSYKVCLLIVIAANSLLSKVKSQLGKRFLRHSQKTQPSVTPLTIFLMKRDL